MLPKTRSNHQHNPRATRQLGRVGQPIRQPSSKPRPVRCRKLRCDCGQVAITVLLVRVGSDPQYIVHLPLCRACLKLEQQLCAED